MQFCFRILEGVLALCDLVLGEGKGKGAHGS